ncbi:MAG: HAD family hydrolase [Pseudomonadales bacterium]
MTAIKGILFDLDGTVLHSALDFHSILNQMLAAHNRPAISYQTLHTQVSNGARAMVGCAFDTAEGAEGFEALREEFLARYAEHCTVASTLYPGFDALLSQLDNSGIKWGIVTNKPALYTDRIMRHLKLADRASSVVCPDHVSRAKPDPEALLLACKQMQLSPAQCLYFGDHQRDIEAGQRAGMTTIGCCYGYLNTDEDPAQWQADHLVEHSEHIAELLRKLGLTLQP